MSKAKLEYDLNDSDDAIAHRRAIKALDLALCLWEIDQRMRETDKYGKEPMTREEFWSMLNEYNISLDDLVQ